ncbi:MAG: ROK family protein [Butyrivibrio sp.]|nr:ROK family protein [Butyrivibrio sp.]
MQTGSKELIRDINTSLILRQILNEGSMSRAELSKTLGLSKATVSAIVQILIEKKLLIETGPGESTSGRRPTKLSLYSSTGFIISIDIDYTKIYCMLSNLSGEEVASLNIKNIYDDKSITNEILTAVNKLSKDIPECPYGLIGISVAIHGIVHDNQIIFTPYYNFEKSDLSQTLSNEFEVPVFINNEANLSAIGEHTFCNNSKNLISVSIHSGIGLGLILNNELYEGQFGSAGEFGHTIIVPRGRICPCGNRGCIEQYASERILLKTLGNQIGNDNITIDDFVKMVESGNEYALHQLEDFKLYISIGLNNIIKLYDPELIIINCDILAAIPDALEDILNIITTSGNKKCKIQISTMLDKAILLGGVVVVRNNFLDI